MDPQPAEKSGSAASDSLIIGSCISKESCPFLIETYCMKMNKTSVQLKGNLSFVLCLKRVEQIFIF